MFDYRASLVRIVDGDSAVIQLDQGFGGRQDEEVRLLGVSAPERYTPGGPECRQFVEQWMAGRAARRWPLYVTTVPNTSLEPTERRTFIRYLATVFDFADRRRCLNEDLRVFLSQHPEWGSGM